VARDGSGALAVIRYAKIQGTGIVLQCSASNAKATLSRRHDGSVTRTALAAASSSWWPISSKRMFFLFDVDQVSNSLK
jgi:hypothetical protein